MKHRAAMIGGDETSHDVRLFLLGRMRAAEFGGRQVKLPRLGLVLAAFLLLESSKMRATREAAASFLWEDLDKKRQAGNLRQLLLRLRTLQAAHGADLFASHEDQVALCLRGVDIDIRVFRAAAPGNSEQRIAEICKVYSGDLLAGLKADGEKLFSWLTAKRSMLRSEFVDSIAPYLEDQAKCPLSDVAVAAARRVIQADPFQEAGYRILMRSYAERGSRSAARQLYQKLGRLLAARMGRGPSSATKELHRALLVKVRPKAQAAAPPLAHDEEEAPRAERAIQTIGGAGSPRVAVLAHVSRQASPVVNDLVNEFSNDLANRLVQTRTFVISSPMPVSASAAVLPDADYVVELRAREGAATPTVSVRLLATATREFLWAASFEGAAEIARDTQIALASVLRHIEDREARAVAGSAEATSAYRVTVEGQRLLRNIDLPSIRRARKFFKAALASASNHVPAMAGLARSFVMEWLVRAPFEASLLEEAEQCARKAVAVCPDDYRGYQELGVANVYRRRLDDSLEHLDRAKALNPDDMGVRVDLADALVLGGQATDAIRLLDQSKHLYDRNDDYGHWVRAGAHFNREDYRATLEEIAVMGDPTPAFRVSAAAHAHLGEHEHARRIHDASMEFNPGFKLDLWLSMFPGRNHEFVQRYSDGLRQAGFT
jgi:DNA-binding SARP family transcriptional activator